VSPLKDVSRHKRKEQGKRLYFFTVFSFHDFAQRRMTDRMLESWEKNGTPSFTLHAVFLDSFTRGFTKRPGE
jgi:hypothetical protein